MTSRAQRWADEQIALSEKRSFIFPGHTTNGAFLVLPDKPPYVNDAEVKIMRGPTSIYLNGVEALALGRWLIEQFEESGE